MNRREVLRVAAGLGISMALLPVIGRAAEPHNDRPSALVDRFQSGGILWLAYRAYDVIAGVMPPGIRWLSAYAVVCSAEDSAKTVAAQMPRAIHDATTAAGERGTIVGHIQYTPIDMPSGADQAEGWTWTVTGGEVAMTMIRSGRWVQILYGPSTGDLEASLSALVGIAASTMPRWPNTEHTGIDSGGAWDALPTLTDIPSGVGITDSQLISDKDIA